MAEHTRIELAERLSAQAATFERNYGEWPFVDELRLAAERLRQPLAFRWETESKTRRGVYLAGVRMGGIGFNGALWFYGISGSPWLGHHDTEAEAMAALEAHITAQVTEGGSMAQEPSLTAPVAGTSGGGSANREAAGPVPEPPDVQPATLESERDQRNPNRRVVFPVPEPPSSDGWTRIEDGEPEDGLEVYVVYRFPDGSRKVRQVLWFANGETAKHVTHWQPVHRPALPQEDET